jgi:dihydropteroate synthase
MGILNVTPDSFSDGGRYADTADAVRRGLRMVDEGADIVDVGGESTRPGARAVDADEELDRVLPVVKGVRRESDVCLSVDTSKAAVAQAALDAGADVVNDVTALRGDPEMGEVVRRSGAGAVLMHMRGTPRTMQTDPGYGDVVAEIGAFLASRAEELVEAGLERRRLAIDPGIGFGKTLDHNLRLLAHLPEIGACRLPVVVGLSRKSFLGKLTGRQVDDRLAGSLGALAYCVVRGVHVMRVHDVKESVDAIRAVAALMAAETGESAGVA